MNATLRETETGFECVDQYGDVWQVVESDGAGNAMVQRDDSDRWHGGLFNVDAGLPFRDGATGELDEYEEGHTFGVTCQEEYTLARVDNAGSLQWLETTSD